MKKLLLIIPFLFFVKLAQAEEMQHGDDQQIFHEFTLSSEFGEARDNRERFLEFEGWIGGDYNRLWLDYENKIFYKHEKEEQIEALYSRNISEFWDAKIGIRHDFANNFPTEENEPQSKKLDYLTLALDGVAPFMIDTNLEIYLSENSDWSAKLECSSDISLTQKLITTPYVEGDFFAQAVPELDVKSGLAEIETGIVTRYEITRKFAPYFALRYHAQTFSTANIGLKNHERVDDFIVAGGIRLTF